jgi:hypothetical protein
MTRPPANGPSAVPNPVIDLGTDSPLSSARDRQRHLAARHRNEAESIPERP